MQVYRASSKTPVRLGGGGSGFGVPSRPGLSGSSDTSLSVFQVDEYGAVEDNETVVLDNSFSTVHVIVTTTDPNASATVNGTPVSDGGAGFAIEIPVGNTAVTVRVTAQNGATQDYHITLHRQDTGLAQVTRFGCSIGAFDSLPPQSYILLPVGGGVVIGAWLNVDDSYTDPGLAGLGATYVQQMAGTSSDSGPNQWQTLFGFDRNAGGESPLVTGTFIGGANNEYEFTDAATGARVTATLVIPGGSFSPTVTVTQTGRGPA